jgi:predicted amidohydrolase
MKVAVCQTSPVLLDLKANLGNIVSHIRKCGEKRADLIVFPELAMTGYFVHEKYHEVSLKMDSPEIKKIAKATKGTAAVVGFIEESQSMNFYNAALVAIDGEIKFSYRKLNLPNYGVFEERKSFSNGKRVMVFRHCGFNLAIFICNDLWHPSIPYLGVTQKADVFITIFNSSRGSMASEFDNIESWEIVNKFYSRIFGIYNICANRVGEEGPPRKRRKTNSKNSTGKANSQNHTQLKYRFWGGSEIINPFGKQIKKAKYFEEDSITAEISATPLRQKKIILPYLRNDDPYFTHRELERILFRQEKPYSVE